MNPPLHALKRSINRNLATIIKQKIEQYPFITRERAEEIVSEYGLACRVSNGMLTSDWSDSRITLHLRDDETVMRVSIG